MTPPILTLRLGEKSLRNLHRFLGRSDLKGHEVPDFLQLLQELRPIDAPAVPGNETGPAGFPPAGPARDATP